MGPPAHCVPARRAGARPVPTKRHIRNPRNPINPRESPLLKAHSAFDVIKHLFFVLLAATGLLLLFFFGYLPWTTHHGETIAVPKITGMTLG